MYNFFFNVQYYPLSEFSLNYFVKIRFIGSKILFRKLILSVLIIAFPFIFSVNFKLSIFSIVAL